MLLRMHVMMIVLSASCDLHDKVALLEMGAPTTTSPNFLARGSSSHGCGWHSVTPSFTLQRVRSFLMALWSTSGRSR